MAALNLPAGHIVHVPPFGPEKPALQWQALAEALEAAASEFAGQLTHASAEVAAEVVE
jgi:hypothetical protein